MHGPLLLPAIGTAGQDERLAAIRAGHQFDLHAGLYFVPVLASEVLFELPQHGLGRSHDV